MRVCGTLGRLAHQRLMVSSMGFLATAAVFDEFHRKTGDPLWTFMSFYLIWAGLSCVVPAAVVGAMDWWKTPETTAANRSGAVVGLGYSIVTLLCIGNIYLRHADVTPSAMAFFLAFAAMCVSLIVGWLDSDLTFPHDEVEARANARLRRNDKFGEAA